MSNKYKIYIKTNKTDTSISNTVHRSSDTVWRGYWLRSVCVVCKGVIFLWSSKVWWLWGWSLPHKSLITMNSCEVLVPFSTSLSIMQGASQGCSWILQFFIKTVSNTTSNWLTIEGNWSNRRVLHWLRETVPLWGNYHLILVKRFECSCEPGGCVVWSLMLLVGSPRTNWTQVRGQTMNSSRRPHNKLFLKKKKER